MKRLFLPVLILILFPFCNLYSQFFETTDTLILEETDDVLLSGDLQIQNVKDDTILVVDKAQSHVLIYNRNGELLSFWGRKGNGPGDLNQPTSALRLPNGNILVTEFSGRVTKFSPSGEVIDIVSTKITRLNKSLLLPNGKVLLTGSNFTAEDHYLLYLFDPEDMGVYKEIFPLPMDPKEYAMQPLTLAESSYATVCGDKIIAAHSMLPELYFFDFEGRQIGNKVIDSELFSVMERVENSNNPNETVKKYGAASWIWGLYCMGSDNIGIKFLKNLTGEDGNPVSFMLTTNEGELLKESSDVPFILFNDHQTDTLYFPDKEAEAPNTFIKRVLIGN
ncbi:MAG TPA: 6-bladed beta-propeller [Gracilimonas sp.]|uniref:6-bladed beta-propeller n=1 Tax=Gracilimonas sp. TaxID=1974203 RepID=UPI002D99E8EC|nr:6-bladed beta-propeller [Gracilimonas sp.]